MSSLKEWTFCTQSIILIVKSFLGSNMGIRLPVCGLACLIAIQEVPGSIPGYTLEIFLEQ